MQASHEVFKVKTIFEERFHNSILMKRHFSYLVALVLRDNFHPAKRKSFNQSKPKVRFIDNTFAYMIFVIFAPHRQDFWVDCCSTQYCVNRAKINNASKQRKEWQYGLLCQNSINRDDTDNVEHNCLLCGPILLHMTGKKVHVEQNCFSGWANFSSTKHAQLFMCSKLTPHKNNCSMGNVQRTLSATNIMYAWLGRINVMT